MKRKVKVAQSCVTLWTVACQALLSMEFSRQEYLSGFHALLQGILPTQGSIPGLPHCRWILYQLSPQGSPRILAAAAKSLQSCPTLCNPIDGSPPGSPVPGTLQARTLEWVAMPSPRDPHNPGIEPRSPTLQVDSLQSELPGKPISNCCCC